MFLIFRDLFELEKKYLQILQSLYICFTMNMFASLSHFWELRLFILPKRGKLGSPACIIPLDKGCCT